MIDLIDSINKNIDKAVAEYDRNKPDTPSYEPNELGNYVGSHQCRHFSGGWYCSQRVYNEHDTYCHYHKKISDGLMEPIDKDEQKVWKNRLGIRYYKAVK